MGLTNRSVGKYSLAKNIKFSKKNENDKVISIVGNPNVGKSTVFNGLTGLKQHTGNWPGKTVVSTDGTFKYKDTNYIVIDLPGTYSLMVNSIEEEIARDFICFGKSDVIVVVCDATCLERNLNLVLQTLEITNNILVCVNLLDEANKKKIDINLDLLEKKLGVPVVGKSAKNKKTLRSLVEKIYDKEKKVDNDNKILTTNIIYDEYIENVIEKLEKVIIKFLPSNISSRWIALKFLENDKKMIKTIKENLNIDILKEENLYREIEDIINDFKEETNNENISDKMATTIVCKAEEIAKDVICYNDTKYQEKDRKIDAILTSKTIGIPIMLSILAVIFWITIVGAEYPGDLLGNVLFWSQDKLYNYFIQTNIPIWLTDALILGMYGGLVWVVSVMLPPMAIFFPLFTLLEDLGYLPRVAFNLDHCFKKACTCGKQSLSMCMGFGCNAAGVIGCRIIDSKRERLIAIITNSFVPCNGRFPMLIIITAMFFTEFAIGPFKSIIQALIVLLMIVLGVVLTLIISKFLSKTILKGEPSSFTLELPPFRTPRIGSVIVRSIFDRTLFVLGRAVIVAAPAGIIIWILANSYINDISILYHCASFLDPLANLMGLDGMILLAFILGFPANEIVFPIIIMGYLNMNTLIEIDDIGELRNLFIQNGWTMVTAVSTLLFALVHWPCSTTCLTIKKESGKWKWALVSIIIPTLLGIGICIIVANTMRLFGIQ